MMTFWTNGTLTFRPGSRTTRTGSPNWRTSACWASFTVNSEAEPRMARMTTATPPKRSLRFMPGPPYCTRGAGLARGAEDGAASWLSGR